MNFRDGYKAIHGVTQRKYAGSNKSKLEGKVTSRTRDDVHVLTRVGMKKTVIISKLKWKESGEV